MVASSSGSVLLARRRAGGPGCDGKRRSARRRRLRYWHCNASMQAFARLCTLYVVWVASAHLPAATWSCVAGTGEASLDSLGTTQAPPMNSLHVNGYCRAGWLFLIGVTGSDGSAVWCRAGEYLTAVAAQCFPVPAATPEAVALTLSGVTAAVALEVLPALHVRKKLLQHSLLQVLP